jgi:hypothetical protein
MTGGNVGWDVQAGLGGPTSRSPPKFSHACKFKEGILNMCPNSGSFHSVLGSFQL